MRLIDADELGEKIEEEFDGICAYDVSPDEAVNDFQDIVDSCKTVDAAPVVHGKWETYAYEDGLVCAVCSACKWSSGAMWWGYAIKHFDFCPHCGAKMYESEESKNV